MSQQDFDRWVARVRARGGDLDRTAFDVLRKRSRDEPVHYYARYMPRLYDRVLNRCVNPGQMCLSQMMAIDARGGRSGHDRDTPANSPKQAPAQGATTTH
jgi:cytochrome o ubiquinol oxidase subunit 2